MNYYEIAINDLESAQILHESGKKYNNAAVLYQQAAEKLLKHVLYERGYFGRLLQSHNLEEMVRQVSDDASLSDDARYLKSFYFDSRYPGDNYVEVDQRQADKCKAICLRIKEFADGQIADLRKPNIIGGVSFKPRT